MGALTTVCRSTRIGAVLLTFSAASLTAQYPVTARVARAPPVSAAPRRQPIGPDLRAKAASPAAATPVMTRSVVPRFCFIRPSSLCSLQTLTGLRRQDVCQPPRALSEQSRGQIVFFERADCFFRRGSYA